MWVSVQQWQKQAQFLPLLMIADRQFLALRHGIVFILAQSTPSRAGNNLAFIKIEKLVLWARIFDWINPTCAGAEGTYR